jgi:hypothetical protein
MHEGVARSPMARGPRSFPRAGDVRMRTRRLAVVVALVGAGGCLAPDLPEDRGDSTRSALSEPLRCVEPDSPESTEGMAVDDDSNGVIRTVAASLAAHGDFRASSLPRDTAYRVRVDVDEEAIRRTADGVYAELRLDDTVVHVVNSSSPRRIVEPAALTLDVGRRELLGLSLIAAYTPSREGLKLSIAAAPDSTGQGPGIPLGPPDVALMGGCTGEALNGLLNLIPKDMPPFHFPKITGCTKDECVAIRRSWAQGHIELFWTHVMTEAVAKQDESTRSFVWGRPGRDGHGDILNRADEGDTDPTAPSYWFGDYDKERFTTVRTAIGYLWGIYLTGKLNGVFPNGIIKIPLVHECPVSGANACFTSLRDPSAHHIVKGHISYCNSFFGTGLWFQIGTTLHEPMHHMVANGRALKDSQTHKHGPACNDLETEPIYGPSAMTMPRLANSMPRELAQYVNQKGESCEHRTVATKTIDSYVMMIQAFGGAFVSGAMSSWPAWGEPTPMPPGCSQSHLGLEGCECKPTGIHDAPDGDWSMTEYCPDDGHELSCVKTTFNASDTVGICTRCEATMRAPGCSCELNDDCATGLICYGIETWNGTGQSSGHCYGEHAPSWACLADCKTLYNDDFATCWHDRLGGARCLDSLCSAPDQDACEQKGLVCRYGDCVEECGYDPLAPPNECQLLGYPEAFTCKNHMCQRPDL